MSARAILGTAATLLLAACQGAVAPGDVYARPVADVERLLLATELPFPLQGTSHAAVQTRRLPDGPIELAIADARGRPQLRFTATVTAQSDGTTRVAVAYAGAGPGYARVDQTMPAHPEIEAVYLKTMREQVDAELDGRPFDNLAIGPEIMAAAAANAGTIARQLQEAGEADRRRDAANISKAYAAEARGNW